MEAVHAAAARYYLFQNGALPVKPTTLQVVDVAQVRSILPVPGCCPNRAAACLHAVRMCCHAQGALCLIWHNLALWQFGPLAHTH